MEKNSNRYEERWSVYTGQSCSFRSKLVQSSATIPRRLSALKIYLEINARGWQAYSMPISETLLTRVSYPSKTWIHASSFILESQHAFTLWVPNCPIERGNKRLEMYGQLRTKRNWSASKKLAFFHLLVDQRYPPYPLELEDRQYLKLFETEYREPNISIIEVNIIRKYRFVSWLDQILFTVHEYIIENWRYRRYWLRYYSKEKILRLYTRL